MYVCTYKTLKKTYNYYSRTFSGENVILKGLYEIQMPSHITQLFPIPLKTDLKFVIKGSD